MSEDFDHPPASLDPEVQNYLDTQWRSAMAATREAREALRRIYPELVQHISETGTNHLVRCLQDLEHASHQLHKAGPHVLGQEEYDEYLNAQTTRQISG